MTCTTGHNVFLSYHHANDQWYKERLLAINRIHKIFTNASVDTGEVSDGLDDQTIRETIRDFYLKDSCVTILLVGTETRRRKHVDWEIYSSMYDGRRNKKSGILVINLPTVHCGFFGVSHNGEKEKVYPDCKSWTTITSRNEYERRYPYMPARIIDNLLKSDAFISVVNWERIANDSETLRFLIDATCRDKLNCDYDLSRPMRRSNS